MVSQRKDLGEFGERVAAHRLEASGMRILARNVRTRGGEIDIVAQDGGDTVFVEVRARRNVPGVAAESLTPLKLRRMWQCAMDYCDTNGVSPERARIDLVSIDLGPRGDATHVEHFRGLEVPEA
ncbi:MAG: YraN family protein [Anaerolinea sp.]|nr:YraN family protein [Anaerolinea sp.]